MTTNHYTPGQALKFVREAKRLVSKLASTYSHADVYYRAQERLTRREHLFERVINRENELRALSINEG